MFEPRGVRNIWICVAIVRAENRRIREKNVNKGLCKIHKRLPIMSNIGNVRVRQSATDKARDSEKPRIHNKTNNNWWIYRNKGLYHIHKRLPITRNVGNMKAHQSAADEARDNGKLRIRDKANNRKKVLCKIHKRLSITSNAENMNEARGNVNF